MSDCLKNELMKALTVDLRLDIECCVQDKQSVVQQAVIRAMDKTTAGEEGFGMGVGGVLFRRVKGTSIQ